MGLQVKKGRALKKDLTDCTTSRGGMNGKRLDGTLLEKRCVSEHGVKILTSAT